MTSDAARAGTIRLEDVARAAGVSRTSASRVMLGQGKVSDATRRKVHAAADRLGYVPNVSASQLAAGASGTIGLLLRDAANPAYGLLFTELQKAAHESGVALVSMTISDDDRGRRQIGSLRHLIGMKVPALIVATGGVTSAQLLPFRRQLPIVRAGRPEATSQLSAVSYDEEDSAVQLAEYVASRGHRDVAVIITREEHSYPEFIRGSTMSRTLSAAGARPVGISVGDPPDGTDEAVRLAREGRVTAVMCPNDLRLLQLMRALQAAGLRVPEDVSVTGCDGILPGIDLMGLTSLRLPVETLARRAIATVDALLSDADGRVLQERLRGTLIPGRTVAAIR